MLRAAAGEIGSGDRRDIPGERDRFICAGDSGRHRRRDRFAGGDVAAGDRAGGVNYRRTMKASARGPKYPRVTMTTESTEGTEETPWALCSPWFETAGELPSRRTARSRRGAGNRAAILQPLSAAWRCDRFATGRVRTPRPRRWPGLRRCAWQALESAR